MKVLIFYNNIQKNIFYIAYARDISQAKFVSGTLCKVKIPFCSCIWSKMTFLSLNTMFKLFKTEPDIWNTLYHAIKKSHGL